MPAEYRVRKADPEDYTRVPFGARLVKACNRCQSRKIKCDGALPQCGSCQRTNLDDCNVGDCVLWTQQHVQALEERIQWLQGLVAQTYEDGNLISGVKTGTTLQIKPWKDYVVEPLVEEVGLLSLRANGSYIGSMSGVTLTRLICTAIRLERQDPPFIPMDNDNEAPSSYRIRAPYPPKTLAVIYVDQYLSRIHQWYPFLDLERLASALSMIYDLPQNHNPDPHHARLSDYDRFTLNMVFSLTASDPNDQYSSAEYFQSALGFMNPVIAECSFDSLRALVLLCLYGLRAWEKNAINCWTVVGHAMRLAIELGLHRHASRGQLGEAENEMRRRLWWSIYGIERLVAQGVCRVLSIRHEAVDQYTPRDTLAFIPPDLQAFLNRDLSIVDIQPAIHLIEQRRLLGEILECVYTTRPRDRPSVTLAETSARVSQIQSRLIAWAQQIPIVSKAETVERDTLQLAFHQATVLLHRPSPSFPCPAADVLDICMGAARGTIRIAANALRNGRMEDVMPGWGGFHSVFMSGLTLMYCSWAAPGCPNAVKYNSEGLSDHELNLSHTILQSLTVQHRLLDKHYAIYQQVHSSFDSILRRIFVGGDVAWLAGDSSAVAAQESGLVGLEGLELDQDSVDFISRLLEGSHAESGVGGGLMDI